MTVTQLELYSGALSEHLGQRPLASLTENTPARYALDQVWNARFVDNALELGDWTFAIRAIAPEYDGNVTPQFGLRFAFQKPDDWIKTSAFSLDPYFSIPNNQYYDDAGYWYANTSPLYIRYVSNDPLFGADMTKWPESFCDWLKVRLAMKIAKQITNSENTYETLVKLEDRALIKARSLCAMNGPTQSMPQGTWVRSRLNGFNCGGGNNGSGTGTLY